MSSRIPSESELEEYRTALELRKEESEENTEPQISKDQFVQVSAWYDASQQNNDRPNSYEYPRVKNLKSIIFDTTKEENGLLNIQEFISLLNIKIPGRQLNKYGDVLIQPYEE